MTQQSTSKQQIKIITCRECNKKFNQKYRNSLYCELHRNKNYRWHRLPTRKEAAVRKYERLREAAIVSKQSYAPFFQNEGTHTVLIDCEKIIVEEYDNNDDIHVFTKEYESGHKIKIAMSIWRNPYSDRINRNAKVWYDDNDRYEFWIKTIYPLPSNSNQSTPLKHQNLLPSIRDLIKEWTSKINSIGGAQMA